jgi:anti-sigma regulatory factor (Ser/Thr protein kinase)
VREPEAAAVARRDLARLGRDLDAVELEIVALLMTELIANSVRHAGAGAGGYLRLDIAIGPEWVRVEVRDRGPGFVPAPREPSAEIGLHWGMHLVAQLADRWQVVAANGTGETLVWFELDRGGARVREQTALLVS